MSERKLPSPIYAAAGASEVVVEQLKKLPAKVDELRDRAKLEERFNAINSAVRENVTKGVETVRGFDANRLRETANETATTLGDKAKIASEKARATYYELVERGEHVTNGERSPIKVISTIANNNGNGNGSQPAGQANNNTKPATAKPANVKSNNNGPVAKKTTVKKANSKKPVKATAK